MIEVFNEQGDKMGVRLRREVHSLGLWHRGVHCFLFDSFGKLLIQRRSESCDTYPNAYDCSISEHLGIGESFEEALVRGCKEELGVSPNGLKKLISYKMQYGPTDNMICELYSAQINENDVRINETEVTEIEFLEIAEIFKRLEEDPSHFTSWFRQQLCWLNEKPHDLVFI